MEFQHPQSGWIEVICGSMFSGKTEELIRRLKRAQIAQQNVAVFKPAVDTRYSESEVVSHDRNGIPSIAVTQAQDIVALAQDAEVVAIDEAQFFGAELPQICNQLANEGKRVIVVGLDMDYLGNPFEPMPTLMAIAEYVTKLHAICVKTGAPAHYSHRTVATDGQVLLGEKEAYEPLSRKAYVAATQN
jgi:thymidine kinase